MQKIKGWWIPDGEEHYKRKLERNGHYQRREIEHALSFVKEPRKTAIDVGANIGFWSSILSKHFEIVYAYEPVSLFQECFRQNVTAANVCLIEVGLAEAFKVKRIQWNPQASGGAMLCKSDIHLLPSYENEVCEFYSLDYLQETFLYQEIGLIKLDCEGYEYFILKGAEQTIRKHKPIINIEDKFDRYGLERGEALRLLESWGATLLGRCYDDCVYGWR